MAGIGASVAVLQGAEDTRAYLPFRQDNNFYYLTGVETPGAILLLDGPARRSILFLPPCKEKEKGWNEPGLFPGSDARRVTGIDDVMDVSEFGDELSKRLQTIRTLYTPLTPYETAATSRGRALQHDTEIRSNAWDGRENREEAFRERLREKFGSSITIRDLSPILDAMRRIKDDSEIELLRNAGRIGALGMREAIRAAKPGMYEYQLAAVAEFVYLWRGAFGDAYFPIVGSGPNSCILHYYSKQRRMEPGDIVVMDSGPDSGYYVSDITRTFPVSGKFSREQAEVYRVVLDAQKAAIDAVRPGATFDEIEAAVVEVLKRSGYAKYVMHRVIHYVGMAVHDVGKSAPLEPGVVIAVEPGVYLPDRNLGVRIEDTDLLTKDGCEILSLDAPKEINEIEKLMASGLPAVGGGD
jgi:Xaa-Pro aminopeptidase